MTAAARALLDQAQRHGLSIEAREGSLKLSASRKPPDALVAQLKAHKAELLHLITTMDAEADYEERAAIVEHGAGVPRDWAEGFARLCTMPRPPKVSVDRWQTFIDDCGRFLDGGWAHRTAELGWQPQHLFGCDREAQVARYDTMGLLWLIGGNSLVELSRESAVIETATGAQLTYRRKPQQSGTVLAWDLTQ